MRSFLMGAGLALAYATYYVVSGLRRNIAAAKATGLPYCVAPISRHNFFWELTQGLFVPIIKLFPQPWWDFWLPPLTIDYSWIHHHDHFARYGDAFLIASPGCLYLFLADAEAIHQVTMRRDHFPKYVEIYSILSQFGDNVLSSEGALWRAHRKVTAASFNERNAALVFRESVLQSLGLLRFWEDKQTRKEENGEKATLWSAEHDIMRLALNIIGYVGFGLRLPWPNEKMAEDLDPISAKYGSVEPPPGYWFSFVDAMAILLDNVIALLVLPSWILALLPSKPLREAGKSHQDYNKFMDELLDLKISESSEKDKPVVGMDFMGQLVRSSYETGPDGTPRLKESSVLGRNEIKGNAFVMLVAGHETTANAVHFGLLHLAGNPASQRLLQKQLDELIGDRAPETWEYEDMLNPLMGSMVGACMNETLRIIPAVIEIPKQTTPDQDQPLTIGGRTYTIPGGTIIKLCAAAVQVNPRYWPTKPSKINPGHSDILEFVPERWIPDYGNRREHTEGQNEHSEVHGADNEDYGGFQGQDTSAQLFKPDPGAYIPFSYGPRACLGRRIAQVEVLAALAVLLREYTVELAVDEWASDEEVARMDLAQKTEVYAKARARKDEVIQGASSLMTLKLRGKAVPVRIVKRGEERFVNCVGSEN